MPRYIDADGIFDEIYDIPTCYEEGREVKDEVLTKIKNYPSADVEEARHGEWLFELIERIHPHDEVLRINARASCSLCEGSYHQGEIVGRISTKYLLDGGFDDFNEHNRQEAVEKLNGFLHELSLSSYCEHCGAKMDGQVHTRKRGNEK